MKSGGLKEPRVYRAVGWKVHEINPFSLVFFDVFAKKRRKERDSDALISKRRH